MFKKLTVFIVMLAVMTSLAVTVNAASDTKEIFTLDKTYNMAVSILFDKESPIINFTTPTGILITGDSFRSDSGDGWIQYYIPNAEPGTWQITYDKKTNTQFDIHYSSYMDSINISEFSFIAANSDNLSAYFMVTGTTVESYQWEIYAIITDDQGNLIGERLLSDGWDSLGASVNRDVDIGNLSDYDDYQLRLDVWQKYGVEEIYDSRIANSRFSVSGHNSGELDDDFRVEINVADGDMLIDWSDWEKNGDYLIAVFNDAVSQTEPFYYTEITTDDKWKEILFDPAAESLRVELTYRNRGKNSTTKSKNIPIDTGVKINFLVSGLTNSSQARIEYEVPNSIKADVMVNGRTEAVNLNGSGSFSINIPDSYNEASMRYSLTDPTIIYIHKFMVTVDNVPPFLRLPENKSAIRVDTNDYILAGVTESDAILMIGGVAATVNPDGTFNHTIALAGGENIIKVTATDWAGNKTEQDIIIGKVSDVGVSSSSSVGFWGLIQKYLLFILSLLFSVGLLLFLLFISRGFRKASNKALYLLRTFRVITVLVGSICLVGVGYSFWKYISPSRISTSEDYFILALKSLDKAYETLLLIEFNKRLMKYYGIALGTCLLIVVLLNLIIRFVMQKRVKKSLYSNSIEGSIKNIMTDAEIEKGVDHPNSDAITIEAESINPSTAKEIVNKKQFMPEPPKYFCSHCGAEHENPVKFCGNCGEKV